MERWLLSAFKDDWMSKVILSLLQIKDNFQQKILKKVSKCVTIIQKFVTSLELLKNLRYLKLFNMEISLFHA